MAQLICQSTILRRQGGNIINLRRHLTSPGPKRVSVPLRIVSRIFDRRASTGVARTV